MPRPTNSVAALFGLAGLCAAALAGAWLARGVAPDAVLAQGFGQALADADVAWSTRQSNVWLSGLEGASLTLGKTLSLGDVITISGKDGRPDSLEVTALEQVDGDRLGLHGLQFQLVTGHPRGAPAGHLVRFLFAVDAFPPGSVPLTADRVL